MVINTLPLVEIHVYIKVKMYFKYLAFTFDKFLAALEYIFQTIANSFKNVTKYKYRYLIKIVLDYSYNYSYKFVLQKKLFDYSWRYFWISVLDYNYNYF